MKKPKEFNIKSGKLIQGDCRTALKAYPDNHFQLIIADPPYYQVLLKEDWDMAWNNEADYMDWCLEWATECHRTLKQDGLFYIFGQHGKREHVWIHLCSMLSAKFQFHDLIVWDRAVGYNERYDSFTPQYEMILVLRKNKDSKPYFNKDAVRIPYDEETIQSYLRDKRYKDIKAREAHLRKGKYSTNIIRVPSLKGSSSEKVGHPSQKPVALINKLIASSSRSGDLILDPFLGSGTTAECAEVMGRKWVGVECSSEYCRVVVNRIKSLKIETEFNL
jgi:DNA modification methylase